MLLTFFPTINVRLCSKNASVVCKEKRNKLFYMILRNLICYMILWIAQFLQILNKPCVIKYSNRVNLTRDDYLYALLPYVCFPFVVVVFDRFFSFGGQKKRSLVALGRCLSYTITIVWRFAWADSALVVLDEWSSYRDSRLNRFDCTRKDFQSEMPGRSKLCDNQLPVACSG